MIRKTFLALAASLMTVSAFSGTMGILASSAGVPIA
jgi:hypothetical protein